MPTDGSGVYTLPSGYLATLGQIIQPSQHNPPLEDVATALTNRLTRNGSGSMTGNFNGGGFRLTNIAAASSGTDAVQLNQADARYVQMTGAETTIASGATVDLATAPNYRVVVSGIATITSFGTGANLTKQVRFTGAGNITHNATSLICPLGYNIARRDGDTAIVQSDGSGNWRIISYFRAGVDGVREVWGAELVAATTNIGQTNAKNVRLVGPGTITSFDVANDGVTRTLRAEAGAVTIQHSANIVCPSGANIVMQIDDCIRVISRGSGVWHVTDVRVLATTTAPGLMSAADKVKVNGSPTYVDVAPVATTSGTAFDFTGLPADVVEIKIMLNGVSLSSTDGLLIQLGDAGGFETTGYSGLTVSSNGSTGGNLANSDGFRYRSGTGTDAVSGVLTLSLMDPATNLWVLAGVASSGAQGGHAAGAKALSEVLTQVRLTRTGTNTFDAGSVAISYLRAS